MGPTDEENMTEVIKEFVVATVAAVIAVGIHRLFWGF